MELRKEIWGPLATKIGERWSVVEAKSLARTARKTSALSEELPTPDKEEHEGDSGIGGSEAELEPVDITTTVRQPSTGCDSIHVLVPGLSANQQNALHHILPRPPPLPLYHPPLRVPTRTIPSTGWVVSVGLSDSDAAKRERPAEGSAQRSVSVKSMLLDTPQN
ncbi:hypothetical protein E4T44_14426 [Aureobasidium sp. EXF-8845]|nr:hypothetical protein E4T44_14426 [Aureobasidium sp. EXF-8845]